MSTIWDSSSIINPSQLREGMVLRVKSAKSMLEAFPLREEDDEEDLLDYIWGYEDLSYEDQVTISEIKEVYCFDGNRYACISFEGVDRNFYFVPYGNDYHSDNLTYNELFEVVQ